MPQSQRDPPPPMQIALKPDSAVLSIQSSVTQGRVGNRAAVFTLERLGFETWPLDTVRLSHHTGHGRFVGRVTDPAELDALLDGLAALQLGGRPALARCAAVVSGYLGDAALAGLVERAVEAVTDANPAAFYLCDPVIGDEGRGTYVRAGVAEAISARLLPLATVATPNAYELALLAGLHAAPGDLAGLEAAIAAVTRRGPRIVLVTSLQGMGLVPPERIGLALALEGQLWLATAPYVPLPRSPSGAGDCAAALFLALLLQGTAPEEALAHVAGALYRLVSHARAEDGFDLPLVRLQGALVQPDLEPVTIERLV